MPTPIKLALSGSGTRLYAHIGATARLLELNFLVEEAIGTSGGAIVAAAACSGMSPKDLKRLALANSPQKLIRVKTPLEALKNWTQGWGGPAGVCPTEPILRAMRATLPETFEELQSPCHIATANYTRRSRPVIWQSGDLPLTVVASMCLPIFDMVEIGGVLVEEQRSKILYGFGARTPTKKDKQVVPGVDEGCASASGIPGAVSVVPELYQDGGISGNFWIDFDQWHIKSDAPILGLRAQGTLDYAIRPAPKNKLERLANTLSDIIDSQDREHQEDAPSARVCYVKSRFSGFDFSFSHDEITLMMKEGSDAIDAFLRTNPF